MENKNVFSEEHGIKFIETLMKIYEEKYDVEIDYRIIERRARKSE